MAIGLHFGVTKYDIRSGKSQKLLLTYRNKIGEIHFCLENLICYLIYLFTIVFAIQRLQKF